MNAIDIFLLGLVGVGALSIFSGFLRVGSSKTKDPIQERASRIRARAGSHIKSTSTLGPASFAGPGFTPGPLEEGPATYAPPEPTQRLPMTLEDVDPAIRSRVEKKVASLPSLPTLTTNLVAMLQDPETEPKEIAKVAATDPAVATEIIRAINSAYFALREPCNDLDRAILLLGYNWVKFLVIRMSMTKSGKQDDAYEARLSALWHRSFMTSECVTALIRNFTRLDAADAATAALLHDLGHLVQMEVPGAQGGVDTQVMFETAGIPVDERVYVEQDLFGINHCLVGGMVAEHLGLTNLVRAVQLYHHHPVNAIWNLPLGGNVVQIIAMVKLADHMVHAFHQRQNPQPQIMTGMLHAEPDIASFRPFFPNLPDFPVLMGFLETELRKSSAFLNTFLPKPAPKPYPSSTAAPAKAEVRVQYAQGPPTRGAAQIGDLVYNNQQELGGPMGWVCIDAGTPGSWRSFGSDESIEEDGASATPDTPPQTEHAQPALRVVPPQSSVPQVAAAASIPAPNVAQHPTASVPPSAPSAPGTQAPQAQQQVAQTPQAPVQESATPDPGKTQPIGRRPMQVPLHTPAENDVAPAAVTAPETAQTPPQTPTPSPGTTQPLPAAPAAPPEPPVPQPAPTAAVGAAPATVNPASPSKQGIQYLALFDEYVAAKKANGEDVRSLNYERFAASIERQTQANASSEDIEYRVLLREGRVVLVGRRTKTG